MTEQVRVIARVSVEAAKRLDEMAQAMPAGAKASRNSVAGAMLERAIMAALPSVPVASYGAPPVPQRGQADRITDAMEDIGLGSSAAVDTLLGLARGTTGLARKGAVSLEKAGEGRLLAWVEEQEAKRGAK